MSIQELAQEALKEIMSTEGQWKEKDLKYFIESFDFRDTDFPNCNKLFVAVTQDMFNWLSQTLDSLPEIDAMTSTFQGGEISIRINEIESRVIKTVWEVAKVN